MAGAIATGQEPQCLLDSPFCSRSHTFPSALKLHPALSCTPGTSHYCQPLRYSGVTWLVGERTTSPLAQRETCHTALMERQLSVIYRIPDRGCRAAGTLYLLCPWLGWARALRSEWMSCFVHSRSSRPCCDQFPTQNPFPGRAP